MDLGLFLEDVEAGAGDEASVEGVDESGLVDHGTARRVDDDGARFHELELFRRDDVPRLGVQRQVQAEDVAALQQLLERHVLCSVGHLRGEAPAVVVDGRHVKGGGLFLHVAPDAAHAQHSQDLTLRVVAQGRSRVAAPVTLAQRGHAGVEVPQGAEHEEDARVCRGVVGGRGHVGDQQGRIPRRAGLRVDLVVAGTAVREKSPRLGEVSAQLGVEATRYAD